MKINKNLNELTVNDMNAMGDDELMKAYKSLSKLAKNEKGIYDNKVQVYQTQMPNLQAGNLDDINKIIWPFIFTTQSRNGQTTFEPVAPNSSISGFINITQEASYVCTHQARAVFERIDLGGGNFRMRYIDPRDFTDGLVSGLTYVINDSQSTRTYHQVPMGIDNLGYGREPTKLADPLFINENNNVEVKFFNNHPTRTYIPVVAFYGYRVRVQDIQEIYSLLEADK